MIMTRQQKAKTIKNTLAAAGLLLGLALASSAAAVQCGQPIGPNQTVTLQADLVCDDNTGGLTVTGPATVNLNGHTIRCVDTNQDGVAPNGLFILGQEAKVRDGIVDSCSYGV